MRFIKNLSCLLFAAIAIFCVGCVGDDFPGTDYPDNAFTVGGTAVSALNVVGDFDIGKADEQSVSYKINVLGEEINGVDVIITHPNGMSGSLGTSTSFPAVRTVSLNDALNATGVALDDVEVADMWTVDYVTDGKVWTSFKINTVTTFKSALAGFMTGTATVTNQGAGIGWDDCEGETWTGAVEFRRQQLLPDDDGEYMVYTQKEDGAEFIEDMSFGAFYPCYDADGTSVPLGDLRLIDIDNKLSFSGASQWGEVYSISGVSTDGPVLSFSWTNDYGEGADIVLTRDDGEDWPDLN